MSNPAKLSCTVGSVDRVGDGVYLLELLPEGRVPRFRPGQFLHLTVDEYDPAGGFWPESRVFSIASRPGSPTLKIVYSVKGRYTKHIEEKAIAGASVWVKLPFGDFVIDTLAGRDRDVVLVAGGTGISPYIPYIEALEPGSRSGSTLLYYGVRRAEQLLFTDLLGIKAAAGLIEPRIRVEGGELPAWCPRAERGILDIARIVSETSGLNAPEYFLSGPPAMIKSFKTTMLSGGVPAERIHIDEWE